ncbi:hypothetical protein BGZ65_007318, partial [Modicella reniformis]
MPSPEDCPDFNKIMEIGAPFIHVKCIDILNTQGDVEEIVNDILKSGEPVVLRGIEKHVEWNEKLLDTRFLREHYGQGKIPCRDLASHKDVEMTMDKFLDEKQTRKRKALYAKDLPFPLEWRVKLMDNIIPWSLRWMGGNDLNAHAIWFMVSNQNSKELSQLWQTINSNLTLENHLASVQELSKANFP